MKYYIDDGSDSLDIGYNICAHGEIGNHRTLLKSRYGIVPHWAYQFKKEYNE
jgi:hypothetical protein